MIGRFGTWLASTKEAAEAASYWATAAGIFIVVLGGIGAIIQYYLDRKERKISYAYLKYEEFISAAIAHPDYAYHFWEDRNTEDRQKIGGYLYFFAKMMWSCEEILKTKGLDPSWKLTVSAVLSDHIGYLRSEMFSADRPFYDEHVPALGAIISEVILENKVTVAAPVSEANNA